jgi:hypothetical protein
MIRYFTFALFLFAPSWLAAQEAEAGFSLPLTISGSAHAIQTSEAGNSRQPQSSAGFRALLSPSLRFNSHWFVYSVIDAQSSDYRSYKTGWSHSDAITARLMQGYIGYKAAVKSASILVKAGRLASAFGLYPLDYDDAKTWFIEPPPQYTATLPLRPDQLPCSIYNVLNRGYEESVRFRCNGPTADRYGIVPVTLYGIPGFETQVSWNRMDARLQVTNSSPANPQSLLSRSQSLQWTAGGGYSFHGGLHLGVSGLRGPYFERALSPFLPPGKRPGDYPAFGIGVDTTFSRGPWSVKGEWQRFVFSLPGWPVSPSNQAEYIELKRVLSPRVYIGIRSSGQQPGPAMDFFNHYSSQIAARQETEELVWGYRLSRLQLLKAGFTYSHRNAGYWGGDYWKAEQSLGAEIQLVMSLDAISKTFH